jgi:hypothetical protein
MMQLIFLSRRFEHICALPFTRWVIMIPGSTKSSGPNILHSTTVASMKSICRHRHTNFFTERKSNDRVTTHKGTTQLHELSYHSTKVLVNWNIHRYLFYRCLSPLQLRRRRQIVSGFFLARRELEFSVAASLYHFA